MPNSNRWKPFINGKRECIECSVLKTEGEYYKRTDGSTATVCKSCINRKRRSERKVLSGRRDIDEQYIRQKECVVCKSIKDLTSDNFKRLGGSRRDLYDIICIGCREGAKLNGRGERRKIGPKHDNEPKFCNICKETKTIKDFSYNSKHNFYSYCCKQCDNERRKKREELNPEKTKEINKKKYEKYLKNSGYKKVIHTYKRIDFGKGLVFGLTEEFVKESLTKDCYYCTYPVTGLDRIDNAIGHIDSNCVPCCTECNRARLNQFTHEEMKIIGLAIKQVKDSRQ